MMGIPPPDGSRLHVGRTDYAKARNAPDPNELRTAEQMRQAGLKYRPALISPTVWVAIALGVGLFVFVALTR